MMKKSILCLILLVFANISNLSLSYADSITFCDYTYSIFYSPVTEKVYLACTGDFDSLDLITIDPITLQEVSNFRVGGLVENVVPLGDGDQLLILLSEMDDDPSTHEGALRKIDALNGDLIPGYEIVFNESPLAMVVDNAQTYAYVTVGLSTQEPSTIIKIDLSSFSVISPSVQYGDTPDVMTLKQDGEKLYIRSLDLDKESNVIGILDTNNMTVHEFVPMANVIAVYVEVGYDNRLFISSPNPTMDVSPDISLIVVDTNNDEVIETVCLDGLGIWTMKVDAPNQKLYGLVFVGDVYDPDLDITTHAPSPMIVEFDLTDPTYTPTYYELGNEGLWDLVVAPGDGYSRLFALAFDFDSPYVYYMDIAH